MTESSPTPNTSWTMVLPSSPESPALARAAIRGVCEAAEVTDDVRDTATLLTSELVTNAYQHGGTAMVVDADVLGEQLRVSVTDSGDDLPEQSAPPPAGTLAPRGRGLFLVASLATRWGTRPKPLHGKAVWFELEPVR